MQQLILPYFHLAASRNADLISDKNSTKILSFFIRERQLSTCNFISAELGFGKVHAARPCGKNPMYTLVGMACLPSRLASWRPTVPFPTATFTSTRIPTTSA